MGCSINNPSASDNSVDVENSHVDTKIDELLTHDSDNDGLSDYIEKYKWRTDPNNPDTDGDGYSDGNEVSSLYSPLIPAAEDSSTGLPEGVTDINQYFKQRYGDNPTDAQSLFILAMQTDNPDWCRKIEGDEWIRGSCFEKLALYLGDIDLCEEINPAVGPHNQEDACYYNTSVAILNDGYCEGLPDDDRSGRSKFECYSSIAVNSGDKTVCDKLNDNKLIESCYQRVDFNKNPEKLQLTADMRLADEQIKADILSLRTLAETYYNKNNEYSGLVFPSNAKIPDCSEDDEYHLDISNDGKSFVAWADLCSQDDSFCIDSNGYRGVTRVIWYKGVVGCNW